MNPTPARALHLPAAEADRHGAGARVGISRPHESAHLHVAGAAPYIDDLPETAGTLHAALGLSPVAHGRLMGINLALLQAQPGVVAVFTATDFPGVNDCGPIVHDDPILADGELRYLGQPVFAVIATSRDAARRAAALAKQVLNIEPLPAVLNPLDAPWRAAMRRWRCRTHRTAGRAASPWAGRSSSTWKARSATPCRKKTVACWCIAAPSTPARCSTWWPMPWAWRRTVCA